MDNNSTWHYFYGILFNKGLSIDAYIIALPDSLPRVSVGIQCGKGSVRLHLKGIEVHAVQIG